MLLLCVYIVLYIFIYVCIYWPYRINIYIELVLQMYMPKKNHFASFNMYILIFIFVVFKSLLYYMYALMYNISLDKKGALFSMFLIYQQKYMRWVVIGWNSHNVNHNICKFLKEEL